MRLNVRTVKLGLFALAVLSIGVAIGVSLSTRHEAQPNIAFSDFIREAEAGKVEEVTISGRLVAGTYRDHQTGFHTYVPAQEADLASRLLAKGVKVYARR